MTVITGQIAGRALVSDTVFGRLVRRVAADEQLDHVLAGRIVDQALAFLGACAEDHDEPLAPSLLVDAGWHAFVLDTREYAAFCERFAGRFLHHVPDTDRDSHDDPRAVRDRTVQAIRDAGYRVDDDLWTMVAKCKDDDADQSGSGNCHQCHAKCYNSP